MLTRGACTMTAVMVALPLAGVGVAYADQPACQVISSSGRCLVEALDPGRPGGPAVAPKPNSPTSRSGAASKAGGTATDRSTVAPPPGPVLRGAQIGAMTQAVPGGAQAALPPTTPVDPAVPARIAINELALRAPVIRMSANGTAFVGVPVWLWIDRGQAFTGPTSATAAVGNAEVRATARLVSVEWSMGPAGGRVVCDGPGTPWTGQPGPSPTCGYVYQLRSLPERTDGSGRWPVQATSVWQVDWAGVSGGAPVGGGQTVRVSSQIALPVGEIQVLVSGGGS